MVFREQRDMKSKVQRTKPGRVDYNDLDVIFRAEEACEAVSLVHRPKLSKLSGRPPSAMTFLMAPL